MTYKGETLSKSAARAWKWFHTRARVRKFHEGKHLILASREGGDVSALRAMGVRDRDIVAVDIDRKAVDAFARRFPEVRVVHGDVAEVVNNKLYRGQLASAHLDFCSWFTDDVLRAAIRVVRFGLMHGGTLTVGVMKGREAREHPYAVGIVDALQQLRYERGGLKWFDQLLNRRRTSNARVECMQVAIRKELIRSGPPCAIQELGSIGYHSGATPMLFAEFGVHRFINRKQMARWYRADLERAEAELLEAEWKGNPKLVEDVIAMAREQLIDELPMRCPVLASIGHLCTLSRWFEESLEFGTVGPREMVILAEYFRAFEQQGLVEDVAGLLNVRKTRLAAWRAVASAGRYGVVRNASWKLISKNHPLAATLPNDVRFQTCPSTS